MGRITVSFALSMAALPFAFLCVAIRFRILTSKRHDVMMPHIESMEAKLWQHYQNVQPFT
jgi:hypothetical protein